MSLTTVIRKIYSKSGGNSGSSGISGTTNFIPLYTSGTTIGDSVIHQNGTNIGIGTTSASAKLHVEGSFRLVDGNQSTGRVLTSDANGVGTWTTLSLNPFSDSTALVKNSTDATKLARFSASSISTGTTRVYTLPNSNGTLALGTGSGNTSVRWSNTNTLTTGSWSEDGINLSTSVPGNITLSSTTGDITINALSGSIVMTGNIDLTASDVNVNSLTSNSFVQVGAGTALLPALAFPTGVAKTTPLSGDTYFDGDRLYIADSGFNYQTIAYTTDITTGVTNVGTGNGLQGGPIISTGTIDLRLNASGGLSKTLGGGSNELGIAASGVTNTMLAGSITAAKLVGTDITTVGTLTTGTLGTGFKILVGSDATGDMYYNGGSGVLTRFAQGAAGTFIRYTGSAPQASTLVLPNAATTNRIVYATGTNTWGESANLTFTGTNLNVNGNVFIGNTTTPTAKLHLVAGTSTANTAPFKLTTGTSNTTAEAGAIEYTTPQLFFTNGGLVRQEIQLVQQSRVASNFNKTSDTTLADITGLTANLAAGKKYRFRAVLFTTSSLSGGVKFSISGTATATSIIYEGLLFDGSTFQVQSRATALNTTICNLTIVNNAYITIEGNIVCNAAGTLTVRFAQNASNGTPSTILTGSKFIVNEIN